MGELSKGQSQNLSNKKNNIVLNDASCAKYLNLMVYQKILSVVEILLVGTSCILEKC